MKESSRFSLNHTTLIAISALSIASPLALAGPSQHNGAVAKSGTQLPAGTPGQVTTGFPSHGSFNVDIDTDLAWSPSTDTSFYDVRFGTNSNAELNPVLGSTPGLSFALDTLDWNTTYYWRIDSWGSFFGIPVMTPGVVFSFTTEIQLIPDFVLIQLVYDSIQEHHIGQSVDMEITILNQGNGPAAGVVVKTYASLDNVITTDDILVNTQTFNPLGFAAGESRVISYAADIPFDTASPGVHYFGAIVSDPDLLETNLNNNTVAGGSTASIVHSVPDFRITNVSYDTGRVVREDEPIFIDFSCINEGEGPARMPQIKLYASLDSTITTSDIQIANVHSNGTIASGETRIFGRAFMPSNFLSFGDYFIGAIAVDQHGLEVNLDNNATAGDSAFTYGPNESNLTAETCIYDAGFEYVIGDANPSTIDATARVRNNGYFHHQPLFGEFYLSQDTTITRDDTLLRVETWQGIPSGNAVTFHNVPVDLLDSPDPLTPGTYYIGIYAHQTDFDEASPEDNGLAGSFPITIIGPCAADLTGEGDLNFFDVSAFLTAFGNQDPIADFTGEGDFNFFDVSAFLTAFGDGCP